MRVRSRQILWIAAASAALLACADSLGVRNPSAPDIEAVLNDPADVEYFGSTMYKRFHDYAAGSFAAPLEAMFMALDRYNNVANSNAGLRVAIPRLPIANRPGQDGGHLMTFANLSRLSRNSADVVQAVDRLVARGSTIGSPGANARTRAFGLFVNGLALGHLALAFDSLAIVTHLTSPSEIPPLSGAPEAMTAALAILDSAIATIQSEASSPDARIPGGWVGSGAMLEPSDLVRLARSYKARLRAGVARTPGERLTVDWLKVLADATSGIQSDHIVVLTAGPAGWFSISAAWPTTSLMYLGVADTSGAYQAMWSGVLSERRGLEVVVRTPDTRWPSGETRLAQLANSPSPLPTGQYLGNRAEEEDIIDDGNPWGPSQYEHARWKHINLAGWVGPVEFMVKAEMDLLAAEAHLRLNDPMSALLFVNASRTQHNLTPFAAPTDLAPGTDGVPGGEGCVPRLPNGSCGTLLEALKYEKRMETQNTGFMAWFIDMRGWGDLPAGTPLHFPVPWPEANTRNRVIAYYDMPSAGTIPGAAPGTYGY